MADLARLTTALKNAHEAGDVEAAQKLASALKQYRDQPQQPQQPETPQEEEGFLERADQGALGLVQGAIVDPLVGIGQLGARLIGKGKEYDEAITNPQEEWYREKRKELGGTGSDFGRGFGTVGTALLPGVGLVGAAGKAGKLGKAAKTYGDAVFAPVSSVAKGASKLTKNEKARKILNSISGESADLTKTGDLAWHSISRGAQAPLTHRTSTEEDQDNYWSNKAKQVGLGAVLGGTLGSTLGRYSQQNIGNTLLGKEMKKLGVGTTGQRTGKTGFEDAYSQSAIGGGSLVRATQDKALKTMKTHLDDKYDEIWNKVKITNDQPFKKLTDKIDDLINKNNKTNLGSKGLDNEILGKFKNIISSNFVNEVKRVAVKPKNVKLKSMKDLVNKRKPLMKEEVIKRNPSGDDVRTTIAELKALTKQAFDTNRPKLGEELKKIIAELKESAAKQAGKSGYKNLAKTDKMYSQLKALQAAKKARGTQSPISTLGILGTLGGGALYNPALSAGSFAALQLPALLAKYPQLANRLGGAGRTAVPIGLGYHRARDAEVPIERKEGGLTQVSHYGVGGLVKLAKQLGKEIDPEMLRVIESQKAKYGTSPIEEKLMRDFSAPQSKPTPKPEPQPVEKFDEVVEIEPMQNPKKVGKENKKAGQRGLGAKELLLLGGQNAAVLGGLYLGYDQLVNQPERTRWKHHEQDRRKNVSNAIYSSAWDDWDSSKEARKIDIAIQRAQAREDWKGAEALMREKNHARQRFATRELEKYTNRAGYANGGLASIKEDYIYDMVVPHQK